MSFNINVSALSKKELEELKRLLQEKLTQKLQDFANTEPRLEQFFDPENYRKNHEKWQQDRDNWLSFFNAFMEAIDAELERRKEEEVDEEIKLLVGTAKDWEGKKIADVFIDDIIKYADTQNGTLLDTLKNIFEKAEKEDFSSLPEEQRNAVKKRMEELRQLVVRGRHMTNSGITTEYTDAVLKKTYEMSKEGLREALRFDIGSISAEYPGEAVAVSDAYKVDKQAVVTKLGWFQSYNGEKKSLGGKSYGCFSEYVCSKCDEKGYNTMVDMNRSQGEDSYSQSAIEHKFLVLRSMGYDVANYNNWSEMEKDLETNGFFTNKTNSGADFELIFDDYKKHRDSYDKIYQTQIVFDSAIQLVLENTDIPGVDKKTRTVIAIRTENIANVTSLKNAKIGDNIKDYGYKSGICESHGHVTASIIGRDKNNFVTTATRVPLCGVRSIWFMEGGKSVGGKYEPVTDISLFETFQFWAHHQNELDICSRGFAVINVGKAVQITDTFKRAKDTIEHWEKKNPDKTTISIINK